MSKHLPIPQGLLDAVVYDPTSPTGLRWREAGRGRPLDRQAGGLRPNGYYEVGFGPRGVNHRYRCHRVIWALHHGDPAELVVDHIDNDPRNNDLANLQAITLDENNKRIVGRGYTRCKKTSRWLAQIKVDGRRTFIGRYDTEEEARAAYVAAKAKLTEGLEVNLAR